MTAKIDAAKRFGHVHLYGNLLDRSPVGGDAAGEVIVEWLSADDVREIEGGGNETGTS